MITLFSLLYVLLVAAEAAASVPHTHLIRHNVLARQSNAPLYLPSGPVAGRPARVEVPVTLARLKPNDGVAISLVSIRKPLPKTFPKAPAECDYLSHLRYRPTGSSTQIGKADRVITFMPGTLAGAGSFDTVARNVVKKAKSQGLVVEIWALDRRANCFEDNYGIQEALKTGKPEDAIKYYYNGTTVSGRKFAGFTPVGEVPLVAKLGADQTIKDWYDVVLHELPDQKYRTTQHYVGGHSLGGSLTAFFAQFDDDGNNKTTADAGYNQAAGYISLDAVLNPAITGSTLPASYVNPSNLGFGAFQIALENNLAPRSLFSLPAVLNAEVGTFLSIAGAISVIQPKKQFPFNIIPKSFNLLYTVQFFEAQNIVSFITRTPDIFKAKITAEAAVGAILGDAFQPFSFIATSCGFLKGKGIVQKDFPFGDTSRLNDVPALKPLAPLLGLISRQPLAAATDLSSDYTWINYNEVSPTGANIAKARNGQPFTNASSEVTDIADISRSLAIPLDFTEHYYPTKLSSDSIFFANGARAAAPRSLHSRAEYLRPNLTFITEEGPIRGAAEDFLKTIGHVYLPGYAHLDVLQASQKPNGGGEEPVVDGIVKFISKLGSGILP